MKSSLASATSLIALLALESGVAHATTITVTSSDPLTIYDLVGVGGTGGTSGTVTASVVNTSKSNNDTVTFTGATGTGFSPTTSSTTSVAQNSSATVSRTYTYSATNTTSSATTTITVKDNGGRTDTDVINGTGVAPAANLAGGSTYLLVGTSGTVTAVVSNSGNGNKSPVATSVSNLNGTIGSAANPSFSGGGTSISLNDNTSKSVAYTFTPTARGATSTTVTGSFSNGGGITNSATNLTATITASGVAPVANLSGGSAGYVLVGQTGTVTAVATNTGDGSLSGLATSITNLNGTIGSASGGIFSGGNKSVSIFDGTSAAVTYTFSPTLVGATSTTVTGAFTDGSSSNGATNINATLAGTGVAAINSVTSTNTYVRVGTTGTTSLVITNVGNGNLSSAAASISNLNGSISSSVGSGLTASGGNPASISLNDGKSSTLTWTYTPLSRGSTSNATVTANFTNGNSAGNNEGQTVTSTVSATGVGPVYSSSFNGTTLNPTAIAGGATVTTGPTVSLGTLGLGSALNTYLTLANTTTDPNGGNTTLTDLTIKSFSLSGANPSDFQISLTPGTVIGDGGTLALPITVIGNTLGLETATLTIFTDEGAAYGGIGDTFTYVLAAKVPEPATLATIGIGLAGLAFVRRRRPQPPAATSA